MDIMKEQHRQNPAFYRYIPFAVFMAFIGFNEAVHYVAEHGLITLNATTLYYMYPLQILVVGYLLYKYRDEYHELQFKDLTNLPMTMVICGIGLLVFFLWIQMDWTFGNSGTPPGYNPTLLPGKEAQIVMTLFRIGGAVLVVPLMEELFWRSFLIRYIIDKDFQKVSLGLFTWPSFLLTVVLFGTEHHFILAGMMAGAIYNLILYRTRSLAQCVLAHAVTNLALALYVLFTGKWYFW
jgi:CAAX prenyl protease-like protein